MTGTRTSGGACGLNRNNAQNLTNSRMTQDVTGVAWLSSVRAVRRLVNSSKRTKLLYNALMHYKLLGISLRKGKMTSSPHDPYELGYFHVLQSNVYNKKQKRELEQNL